MKFWFQITCIDKIRRVLMGIVTKNGNIYSFLTLERKVSC